MRESPSYGQTPRAQKTILRKRIMSGFKSKREKLEAKLAKTLKEAFELSHTDRKKSDEKNAEADEITKQLDALDCDGSRRLLQSGSLENDSLFG